MSNFLLRAAAIDVLRTVGPLAEPRPVIDLHDLLMGKRTPYAIVGHSLSTGETVLVDVARSIDHGTLADLFVKADRDTVRGVLVRLIQVTQEMAG